MLISKAIHIEEDDVNLKKGARKQTLHSRPAYDHLLALAAMATKNWKTKNSEYR